MKKLISKFLFLLIGLIGLHHMVCMAFYLMPKNPFSRYYLPYAHAYMSPYFGQNWQLFAPEPATFSLQFWFRCQKEDKVWTSYQDPIANLIKEHKENPFTYRGKLTYVYQSMARSLMISYIQLTKNCKDSACRSLAETNIKLTPDYQNALRFTENLCKAEFKNKLTATQMQVLKIFPKQFSQRKQKLLFSNIEKIEFRPDHREEETLWTSF